MCNSQCFLTHNFVWSLLYIMEHNEENGNGLVGNRVTSFQLNMLTPCHLVPVPAEVVDSVTARGWSGCQKWGHRWGPCQPLPGSQSPHRRHGHVHAHPQALSRVREITQAASTDIFGP